MPTTFGSAVARYVQSRKLAKGTSDEYKATVRKWLRWDQDIAIEDLGRPEIRDFLDWVYDKAVEEGGVNPDRTANKVREHVRAVLSWAWENDMLESLPRFPKPRDQRNVAGLHYLTKAQLNAIYFATYGIPRPRGWSHEHAVGQFWRAAIVLFFNYGFDTGTIWKTKPIHEPILWRHIAWDPAAPHGQTKKRSRFGWLYYRRVKTGKSFYRPMNRGHSVGGVTYRHYAHRDPLAFKAILSLPQPTAFTGLANGYEGKCPCCRREFPEAGAGR